LLKEKEIFAFDLRFYVDPTVADFVDSKMSTLNGKENNIQKFITAYYYSVVKSVCFFQLFFKLNFNHGIFLKDKQSL
jgi:hypothetical protein